MRAKATLAPSNSPAVARTSGAVFTWTLWMTIPKAARLLGGVPPVAPRSCQLQRAFLVILGPAPCSVCGTSAQCQSKSSRPFAARRGGSWRQAHACVSRQLR